MSERREKEGGGREEGRGRRKNACMHTVSPLQLWECGIEQCKEIASQLETVTFDYEKLSDIHVSRENHLCASELMSTEVTLPASILNTQ